MTLPAFGSFTGGFEINWNDGALFAAGEQEVIPLNPPAKEMSLGTPQILARINLDASAGRLAVHLEDRVNFGLEVRPILPGRPPAMDPTPMDVKPGLPCTRPMMPLKSSLQGSPTPLNCFAA